MADRRYLQQLTKKLADEGKLIEAGWVGMRLVAMHPDSPPEQVREMRLAYMAGAQHLFSSIMLSLDPDHEPTVADMHRMNLIAEELESFAAEMKLRFGKPGGDPK